MKILVYGCAEFGQVVRNLVTNCRHEFTGFIDDYIPVSKFGIEKFMQDINYDTLQFGTYEEIKKECSPKKHAIAIAVGYKDLKTRWDIYQKVKNDGYKVPALIHPKAIVDKTAKIGEGAIIMAGAIVDYKAEIKDLAVLWNGVNVSHDSVIGENTFLSPGSTVCGCSTVGRDSFIGAGAVVIDHKKVADGSFVKAGGLNAHKRIV